MKRVVIAWAIGLLVISGAAPRAASEELVGVLVMAHGGTKDWDGMIRKAVKSADLSMPVEVALGMGMHSGEVRRFQEAVNKLERRGVTRIVVVPLLVSSYSEVYRQFEYLLGIRKKPEWPVEPLRLEVPVVMGKALDDHPLVAEVLLERAQELSRDPANETVVLVGHGPNGDDDNRQWLDVMNRLAARVKEEGKFHEVATATMRDDASKELQDKAKEQFRAAVQTAGAKGRVLIVPLLMARGGIEEKIPKLLSGLSYVYRGQTLLPSRKIEEWIARQAQELSGMPTTAVAKQPPAGDYGKDAGASQTAVLQ